MAQKYTPVSSLLSLLSENSSAILSMNFLPLYPVVYPNTVVNLANQLHLLNI